MPGKLWARYRRYRKEQKTWLLPGGTHTLDEDLRLKEEVHNKQINDYISVTIPVNKRPR